LANENPLSSDGTEFVKQRQAPPCRGGQVVAAVAHEIFSSDLGVATATKALAYPAMGLA